MVSHTGILQLTQEAKNSGNPWADCALAEIGLLVRKNYVFRRDSSLGSERYTIEIER